QAEDGIRGKLVTGVQTCALPILAPRPSPGPARRARPPVVFECVGVPGVLDQVMAAAPRGTRIVVVGVCMEPDTIHPLIGIVKERSEERRVGKACRGGG